MIDWTAIDKLKASDWTRLAESLLQKAIAAIQAADANALRQLQADFLDFTQSANLVCPPAVLTNINSTARQIAQALLAIDIGSLDLRSAKLDAAGAKVSVAATAIRAEDARIRLEGVRKTLDQLTTVARQFQEFRSLLETLPKKDLPARLDPILALLDQFDQHLRAAIA